MHPLALGIRNKLLAPVLRGALRPRSPEPLVRLGTEYGGWWVPRSILQNGTVAYCAGAGEDISFDLELQAHGLRVTTFDPTPRAIAHVEKFGSDLRFQPVGWWDEDTTIRFYVPRDPAHVSHSALNLQGTDSWFDAPVQRPSTLMVELGDDQVDLIKMDIEGAEYTVLKSLLRDGPLPRVLCVEFDQPQPVRKTLRMIRELRDHRYALAHIDGWNYTFLRSS